MTRRSHAIVVSLALVLSSPVAIAHAFLDRADPAVGSRLRGAPTAVTLWFTEDVEPSFSTVKVFDAHGARIDRGDVRADASDHAVLRVGVAPLAPGTYRVVWHAVSVDTHVTDGDFTFTVAP